MNIHPASQRKASQCDAISPAQPRARDKAFTLIEMIGVLAVIEFRKVSKRFGDVVAVAENDLAAEQGHVDPAPLAAGVREALRGQRTVGLKELVTQRPIQQGLAELVTYLSLKDETFRITYDEQRHEEIGWTDREGASRVVTLPRVSYARMRR